MNRYVLTGILIPLCFAGSAYIVLESAGYYQNLYLIAGLSEIMGWYTAILSEVFQLTLVMLLPTGKKDRVRQLAMLLLISLIYLMTIFAAGMNIGKPLIEKWSESVKDETLFGILLKEQSALSEHVDLFNGQNQKLNTAISVQAQRESFSELKSHLKSVKTVNGHLIQIELIALWLLRILIQLSNLICGRFIALKWREIKVEIRKTEKLAEESIKTKVVKQWKARYTRNDKGFVGIMELNDGNFIAVSPNGKRKYKSFQGALNYFNGSSLREKIPDEPTYENV